MATPNIFTDCRFCLEKKRHVIEITEEVSNVYFSVTQIKLARLHSFSNSVCLFCYKKILSAQSYREMLIKIEQKLLSTFNHTQIKEPTPSINRAIRSNGKPTTSETTTPNLRKFAREQMIQYTEKSNEEEDEDMSLLEEMVSADTPNTSSFFNEQDSKNLYQNLLSDEDTKNQFDENSSFKVKSEPDDDDRPMIEIKNVASEHKITPKAPSKPYKCTVVGCSRRSTTLTALQKHRRRAHGIMARKHADGSKIIRSKPSPLYQELEITGNVFKCKFCNIVLRNRRVLLRHIETVHMKAKFICQVSGCNHASTRKDNYRLHLKNYHRDLPENEMERVLNETRTMKPVYANNLTELQMQQAIEVLQSAGKFDFNQIAANDEEEINESLLPKNGEMAGFSFIDIAGGVDEEDLL